MRKPRRLGYNGDFLGGFQRETLFLNGTEYDTSHYRYYWPHIYVCVHIYIYMYKYVRTYIFSFFLGGIV